VRERGVPQCFCNIVLISYHLGVKQVKNEKSLVRVRCPE
jgi:hypothetical protein